MKNPTTMLPQRQYGSKKLQAIASIYKCSIRSKIAEKPSNPLSLESLNLNDATKSHKKGTNTPDCNASIDHSISY